MQKTFDPHLIENKHYQFWENNEFFKPSNTGTPYCIMIPPPNVTGTLHMGHGFQYSLMDALIRYQRMQGRDVLWQVGTDHAGIATQMVVERQLQAEGQTRHDLGREKFVEKVWDWKQQSGNTIVSQMRRLGVSVDWSRERFTLDPKLADTVVDVFVKLHEKGLIYRGQRLVNWDPVLKTAISDLEVIPTEEQGKLWHFRYPLVDSNEYIVIATTRPETLLGDSAVAVNPDDPRYQHLIGKQVSLPLCDRSIPIIADDYVDQEFGTGCVKITPAHDFNDYEVGKRHQLPQINILNDDASLNANVPEKYQGLDRFAAREQVIADLDTLGLVEKIEDHVLKAPRGEKSNVIVEPYLTDQWFVKCDDLAARALKVVHAGDIKFIPENWLNTYNQWLNNIQDWCISRQLWWGHRIPAWYDEANNIYVARTEAEVREKYQLKDDIKLRQDNDVLDTWFSSALWPFSTLDWPDAETFKKYYPTNVLVTGFDIIFFWVARMIMMGLEFTDSVPFHEVYITGLIRDHEGQKMSKSKGNVLDPIDLVDGISLDDLLAKRLTGMMQPHLLKKIEKATRKQFPDGIESYGTDALRFTYYALATQSRDINFDIGRIQGYRNFCNKLWNATRYVMMVTEGETISTDASTLEFSLPDQWIWSKLQETISEAHRHFANYRFDLLSSTLYDFTWHHYCDWYLELSKPSLNAASRYTLVHVLEHLLRLLHPLMPFITEELWQSIKPLSQADGETIMLSAYPQVDNNKLKPELNNDIEWLKQFIIGIRTIRAEMTLAPGKALPILLDKGDAKDKERVAANELFLTSLAKLESITWLEAEAPPAATALVGDLEILIPLKGLINVEQESARLNKEIAKLNKDLEKSKTKLANPNYAAKAPAEVVAKEQERLAALELQVGKLSEQLEKLKVL